MPEPQIISDPAILMGKPVIAGTRITVEHILSELGAGRTYRELTASHPQLDEASIRAALTYAARHIGHPEDRPLRDAGS